jgi:DNA-binding PadR family transcriptional regulator
MDLESRLTTTSYVLLALVEQAGRATPYDLEVMVRDGVVEAWPVGHTQVYQRCRALVGAGYLEEHCEAAGRRRRFHCLTDAGRAALQAWLETPTSDRPVIRDPGLLQVCCGASLPDLAVVRAAVHLRQLREIELRRARLPLSAQAGVLLTLEAAMARERTWLAFWDARRG